MLAPVVSTSIARLSLVAALVAGCGVTTTSLPAPTPDAASATDVAAGDAGAAPLDAAPVDDGSVTSMDGGAPGVDAGVVGADVVAPDSGAQRPDARPALDAPRLPGATVTGTWRAVRYEAPDPDRGMVVLTDRDTLFALPDGGMGSPFRVNGVLSLQETRMALTLALLSSGHLYPFTPTGADDPGWSGVGYTVPGLLTVTAASVDFEIPGGTSAFRFERTADDSLVLLDADSGSRTTFVRDPMPARMERVNLIGVVWRPDAAPTPTAPRAMLQWDMPGAGAFRGSHDVTLSFMGDVAYATIPVTIAGAPAAEVSAATGGVTVASAYVLVYDDTNGDERFDPTVDTTLAQSPMGVAWRGAEAPNDDYGRSAFVDLNPGWQVVHYHRDFSTGRWAVTPFDNTSAPAPDTVLRAGYSAVAIELR